MTESIRKVPLLADLPVIGQLFQRKVYSEQEAETLIFITPRIIKEEAAPATLGPI
jgi:type IV pilus assembly protein PilQ